MVTPVDRPRVPWRDVRPIAGLLFAFAWLIVSLPAYAQTRVALVIGNGAYQHTQRLANPVNDARAVAESLRRLGFQVTEGFDQNRSAMLVTLREFGDRARGAEVALVFFAGHGMQVARGGSNAENYLLPVDARLADIRDVEDEALSLGRVLERLDGATSRVVILDACRDNPLAQRNPGPGLTRSVGRGLAPLDIGARGTLVAFATDPGRTAADGTGRHSPFTAALLDHLPTPGLELRQVLTRVRQQVVQATQGRQTPWSNDGLLQEVFLARPPAPPPPLPAPAPAPTAEQAQRDTLFWQGIQASRDPSDYEHYLQRFPDGLFRELARQRIATLRPAPSPPAAPPPPRPLQRAEIQEVQRRLAALGLDPGVADGNVGPRLGEALQAFAIAAQLGAAPELNSELLPRLRQAPPPPERIAAATLDVAQVALDRGDDAGAQRMAIASLRLLPTGRGQLLAGDAAQRQGEFETARQSFLAAQQLGASEAAARLSALDRRRLQPAEIQEVQRRLAAMGLDAGVADGRPNARLTEALAAFARAAQLSGPAELNAGLLARVRQEPPAAAWRAAALLDLAEAALRQGDDAAVQRLTSASLAIAPSARGHLLAGEVLQRRGQIEAARQAFLAAERMGATEATSRLAALPPPPPRPLERPEIQEVQRWLSGMGLDPGGSDGNVGPRLQEALQAFAIASQFPGTPQLNSDLLARLRREPPSAFLRADALLDLAEAASRRGDDAGALRLTSASLRLMPTGRGHLLAGDRAQRQGQIEAARRAFEAAEALGANGAAARLAALPPPPPRPLQRPEIQELQERLQALGFDVGGTDGVAGPRLREALQAFAMARGFSTSPDLTTEWLTRIQGEPPSAFSRANALLDLADAAWQRGDTATAQRLATTSLRITPTARGHLLAGDVAQRLGQRDAARVSFEAAQALGAPEAAARIIGLLPPPPRVLNRQEIQSVQRWLAGMGFDAGGTDGVPGPGLEEALRAYALAAQLPSPSALDVELLPRLRQPAPSPPRRAMALLDLAEAAAARGDEGALSRLTAASLALAPTARGHLLAGDTAQRRGQLEDARAAYQNAQRLGAGEAAARLAALPPPPPRLLDRAEIQDVQRRLAAMGFDAGGTDGGAGPRLREALQAFAMAAEVSAPVTLDSTLLPLIRRDAPPPERRAAALLDLAEAAGRQGDDATLQRLTAASLRISQTARGNLLAGETAQRLGQTEAARQAFEAARRLGNAEAGSRLAALPPPPPRALQRNEIQEVQRRLLAMGFDAGGTDGNVGPRLREALRAWATAAQAPQPPELNSDLLPKLREEMPSAERRTAALLDLGDGAMRSGDHAAAQRFAAAALRISPTARGRLLLGDAAQRLGQTEPAREAFLAAQRLGASEATARLAALPPPANRPLQRPEIAEAQRLLTAMGFDTGGTSGASGPRSQEALRAFQIATGRTESMAWTTELLDALRQPAPPGAQRARAFGTLGQRAMRAGTPVEAVRLFEISQSLAASPETGALLAEAQRAVAEEQERQAMARLPVPREAEPSAPAVATPAAVSMPAVLPQATSVLGADGRLTEPYDAGALRASWAPGYPSCLVVFRRGAGNPFPIEGPTSWVAVGGRCPSIFWQGNIGSLEEFGRGIVTLPDRGRCQIPVGLNFGTQMGGCEPLRDRPLAAPQTAPPSTLGQPSVPQIPSPPTAPAEREVATCVARFTTFSSTLSIPMNAPHSNVICRVTFNYGAANLARSIIDLHPKNGTLVVTERSGGATWEYRPNLGYHGEDKFIVRTDSLMYGGGGRTVEVNVNILRP